MKKVILTENLPIYMWLEDIEDGVLQQAKNIVTAWGAEASDEKVVNQK